MVIPSGLIPPGGKSAIDKILFIPNKYGGFFRLISLLLNVYRRDRQSFRSNFDMVMGRGIFAHSYEHFGVKGILQIIQSYYLLSNLRLSW